jgi:hypothetical protein
MEFPDRSHGKLSGADAPATLTRWCRHSADAIEISVLLPCWHGEESIGGALSSINHQRPLPDGRAVEVVVVVDGRLEDEEAVRQWIAAQGDALQMDVVLVVLAINGGVGQAQLHGYRHCRGRFLAFLDDDDCWAPEKLLCQWQWHQEHPDQIVSAHRYASRPLGSLAQKQLHPEAAEGKQGAVIPVRSVPCWRILLGSHDLAAPTLMINRALWRYQPESVPCGNDWLMVAMVAAEQPIARLEALWAWRSPLVPPLMQDPWSLSRRRWRMRWANMSGYGLLWRRGVLHPAVLLPLWLWQAVLMLRRWLLDGCVYVAEASGSNRR